MLCCWRCAWRHVTKGRGFFYRCWGSINVPDLGSACRGSLRRLQVEQVAVGQLHWSASKYAPLQEWALVNGIADCYLQVPALPACLESFAAVFSR